MHLNAVLEKLLFFGAGRVSKIYPIVGFFRLKKALFCAF